MEYAVARQSARCCVMEYAVARHDARCCVMKHSVARHSANADRGSILSRVRVLSQNEEAFSTMSVPSVRSFYRAFFIA